jgi:hypothetical protein
MSVAGAAVDGAAEWAGSTYGGVVVLHKVV